MGSVSEMGSWKARKSRREWNSTLTWLLKDSLGGNSKTVMLATISPVADSYQETMSTLRHVMYVERAKDIVNIVSPNQVRTNPLIGKLREEIRMLKEWLKQKDSLIVEHEKREALLKKVLQRTRAACDERAMRAIADNPGTQEALRKERQKRSGEAAAAADALNHVEQRHQENMKLLVEWHREALTVSRRTSEGNIRKAREENAMCMQQLVSTQKRARAEGRRYAREMEHADKNARSASEEFGLHENELGGTSETAVGQLSVQRAETAEAANGVKVGLNPTVVQRELEAVQNLQPMLASVTMGSSQECHYDEALQVTDGSEQEAHMGLTSPRRDTELDTVGAVGQATAEAVCVYLGEDHGFGGQEKKEVMCLRDSFMNAFPGIGIEAGDRLPIETQQVPSVARFPQEAGPNVKDDMCKRSFTDSHIASAEGEPLQLSANLKPELSTKSGAIPSAPADAEISLFQRRVDTPFSEANAASQDSTGEEVQGPTEVRATTKDDEVNGVKLVVGLKDEPDFYSDPESGLRQDRTCSVSVQGQLLSANKVVEEQDKVTPPLEWEASRSSEPGTTTSRHEDKDRVHASVRLRDMDESLTVTTAEKAVTNETVVETASAIAALSDNDISGLLKELGRRLVGRGSKISAVGEGETTDLDRAVIRLAQTPLEQRANAISASLLQDKLHQDEIHFLLKGLEGSSAKDFRVNEKENSTGNNEARFVPDFKAVQEEAILPMKRKMRKTTLLVEPDIQVAMNERKQPADEVRRHEQDFEATSMERGPRSSAFSSRSDLLLANKEEALLISELKKSRRDEGINVEGLEVETGRQRQVDVVGVSEGSNLSTSDAKEETAQSHAAFRDDYIRKRASQGDAQSVNTASAEEGVKTAEQCLTEREILVVDVGAAGDSLGAQHSHECLNLYESEVDRLEQTPANFERNIWKERVKATAALTALEASHRMMLREIKARHGAEISSLRAMNKCCWGDSFPTDSPPFSVLFDPETQESELMGGLEKKNMGKVTYTHSDEKKIRMFPVEDVSEHISPEQSDFKTVRRTSPAALKRPIMLGDDRIVLSTNGRSVHKLECDAGGTAGTTREPVTEIGDLLPPMVGRPQTEHRIGHDRTSETSRDEENPMVSSPREAREKLLEASHELTGTLSVINIVDGVETVGAPNDGYARTPEAGLATHVLSSKDVTEGGGLAAQDTARDLAISSVPTETMAASAKNNWLQLQAQEEMHGAALNDADQRIHEKMEACLRRAEAAEAVAKETDALYKEALARAEVLEDMMQSSTIPREHELAGLRASIVQLEAFFARQIENTATGSSGPTALLLRQRSADLSALAVCTTRGLESGDAIPLGTGEFAVGGLRGDLSPEQYVGELEKTLVRTTMEAAAARQDHLEADLELNCLTKQLAGLKVVQAQLRERLEDAQMKLHQRSHSTARRWLASAARLARNFARPDWPSMSPLPPRVESETSFVNNRSPHGRSSSKPTSGPNGICSPPPFKRVSSLNSAFDFNTRS